ncbi:MAG TPA: ABC transporter permease [Vicinamibacterales bacterium]|nr:ABC transporter permease [Vicinamibacterales bacterium]
MSGRRVLAVVEHIWLDARYASRALARRPVITAAAVVSLAVGIGVNTAIFSVFELMMLRRLSVPAPDELVRFGSPGPRPGGTSTGQAGGREYVFSLPLFRDIAGIDNTGLEHIAAYRDFETNLSYDGQSERGQGLIVSGDYFRALRVGPVLGRVLVPDDDAPVAPPVAVLSFRYWSTRFGSAPGIVGRTLLVNGRPVTVVGVAQEGFQGITLADSPQLFVPLSAQGGLDVWADDRRTHWLYIFGRLKAGTSRQQVQAAMNGPFAALIQEIEFPVQGPALDANARAQFLNRRLTVEDGSRGALARSRTEARPIFALAMAVTGLVLLIACANLANLMLARGADRVSEIAVRLSLGSSPGGVVRILLTEACLLSIAGGLGGLLAARATLRILSTVLPGAPAILTTFEINTALLVFTLGTSFGTAILFGLFPAMHSVRAIVARSFGESGGRFGSTRAATRFRTALATTQIALTTALLGQAMLLALSLSNVTHEELGLEPRGVLTFGLAPHLNGYDGERTQSLIDRVQAALNAVPSVVSSAATTRPVLAGGRAMNYVTVQEFMPGPDTDTRVNSARISPEYFRTLGIRLLAGREFSASEVAGSPKVAVVNESFARLFRLGPQPVGRRLGLGRGETAVFDVEIVGLVADAKSSYIAEPPGPQLFLPLRQGSAGPVTFYLRTDGDPRSLMSAVRDILKRIDQALPVERLRTMEEQIRDNAQGPRVLAGLSGSLAGIAMLLAGVGLYGLLSYTVARRTREIGIRVALGATRSEVWRLLFTRLGWMTALGGLIGVVLSVALGRVGSAMLFEVRADSPLAVTGALALVIVVSILAAVMPARRAATVDPAQALRFE